MDSVVKRTSMLYWKLVVFFVLLTIGVLTRFSSKKGDVVIDAEKKTGISSAKKPEKEKRVQELVNREGQKAISALKPLNTLTKQPVVVVKKTPPKRVVRKPTPIKKRSAPRRNTMVRNNTVSKPMMPNHVSPLEKKTSQVPVNAPVTSPKKEAYKGPPLYVAVMEGNLEKVALFAQEQAAIGWSDKLGYSLLHKAVEKGCYAIVVELLYRGIDVNIASKNGYTPLHQACQKGDIAIMTLLLQNKGNMLSIAKNGLNALDLAIIYDKADLLDFLSRFYGFYLADYNKHGDSLMHVAAQYGSTKVIHQLAFKNKELLKVASCKDAPMVFNINKRGTLNKTPLHIAAQYGQITALKQLLFANANIEAQAVEGYRPLHIAVQYGQTKAVEELVRKGASIDAKTTKGETPLMLGNRLEKKGIIEILDKKE